MAIPIPHAAATDNTTPLPYTLTAPHFLNATEASLPTLGNLVDSHRELSDRAKTLLCKLYEADGGGGNNSVEYDVINRACIEAIETSFVNRLDEASIILEDVHSGNTSDYLTAWHVKLAQNRCASFLDSVELAMRHAHTNGNHRTSLHDRVSAVVCQIASQRHNGKPVQVIVSPWTIPNLAFEVVVGGPVLYNSSDTSVCSIDNKALPPLVGIFTEGTLPIIAEVRVVAQVKENNSNQPACASLKHRACQVDIVRCVHRHNDAAVLLAIRPVVANNGQEGLKILQARMIQLNAKPPRLCSSLDLYTSSTTDNEEVTIALRFLTRKSIDEKPPHMLIDILISTC